MRGSLGSHSDQYDAAHQQQSSYEGRSGTGLAVVSAGLLVSILHNLAHTRDAWVSQSRDSETNQTNSDMNHRFGVHNQSARYRSCFLGRDQREGK